MSFVWWFAWVNTKTIKKSALNQYAIWLEDEGRDNPDWDNGLAEISLHIWNTNIVSPKNSEILFWKYSFRLLLQCLKIWTDFCIESDKRSPEIQQKTRNKNYIRLVNMLPPISR